MTETKKSAAGDASGRQLEKQLLDRIDAVAAANTITSQSLLSEIAELKAEIARLCQAGAAAKARRLAELVVSRVRAGEPPKE